MCRRDVPVERPAEMNALEMNTLEMNLGYDRTPKNRKSARPTENRTGTAHFLGQMTPIGALVRVLSFLMRD